MTSSARRSLRTATRGAGMCRCRRSPLAQVIGRRVQGTRPGSMLVLKEPPLATMIVMTTAPREERAMALTTIPCPTCGMMNALTAETCSACGCAFVPASERAPNESRDAAPNWLVQRGTGDSLSRDQPRPGSRGRSGSGRRVRGHEAGRACAEPGVLRNSTPNADEAVREVSTAWTWSDGEGLACRSAVDA